MTAYATTGPGAYRRPPRTELERLIWDRRQTIEEFAAYVERFARDHNEPGTLSVRHLQRLAAGCRSDSRPLGSIRPATARLLEHIFQVSSDELLSAPVDGCTTVQQLTVAVAVVRQHSQVLLVRRRESQNGARWQFPAGIVKPGAGVTVTAEQETVLETGVICTATAYLGNRIHPQTHVRCHYVLCQHVDGTARNLDPLENMAVACVDVTKLARFIPLDHIFEPVLAVLTGNESHQGGAR